MVRDVLKSGLITGTAVDARPVWMLLNQILIAQVWESTQKSRFIWTISVVGLITDHIPGNLATTPREVARHFALKWQMDAEQIMREAKSKPLADNAGARTEPFTNKLIQQAELLYDLHGRDEAWK